MNIKQQSTCFEKYFVMKNVIHHPDHGDPLRPPEAMTDGDPGETEVQLPDSSGGFA